MSSRSRRRHAYLLQVQHRMATDAALRAREPRKARLMPDDDAGWKVWACEQIMQMCRVQLHRRDPDAVMQDYFDQAGEGDEEYLVWSMAMWRTIRTMTSLELERTHARANRMAVELEPWLRKVHEEHLPATPEPPINRN